MTPTSSSTPNKPVETVRIGAVVAALWRNVTEDGRVRFNATLERIYTDENGDWKSTGSFGRDDLLVVAKVADQTHTRIHELQDAERETARTEQQPKAGNDTAGRKATANAR